MKKTLGTWRYHLTSSHEKISNLCNYLQFIVLKRDGDIEAKMNTLLLRNIYAHLIVLHATSHFNNAKSVI